MYVVTDSNTSKKINYKSADRALLASIFLNTDEGYETIRGAIVTALHWIEQVEDK